MKITAFGLLFLALVSILAIGIFYLKRLIDPQSGMPEPIDLIPYLVDKPELIGILPENEDIIPDYNTSVEFLEFFKATLKAS